MGTPAYQIHDLGVAAGGTHISIADVNANGDAVGSYLDALLRWHGFLRTSDGTQTDLGTLLGLEQSMASGINLGRQVVIGGLMWSPSGSVIHLNALASDINNAGQCAGTSYDQHQRAQAYLWQPDGTPLALSPLYPGGESMAHGMNELGETFGEATSSPGTWRAVRWSPDGNITALGLVEGHAYPTARTGNEAGQVVGTVDWAYPHAVLWSQSGVPQLFQELAGSLSSTARDINSDGLAIGTCNLAGTASRAVVWDASGVVTGLGTLTGGMASRATNIYDDGRVFGTSDDEAGSTHLVMWTPLPEPSSLLALLAGLGGLGGMVWRRRV